MEPWRNEAPLEAIQKRQLEPVIIRLFAYYPGAIEPNAVDVIHSSEPVDLVLLGARDQISGASPLVLETSIPKPGEEVLLLGYPTGLRALVARASPEYLQSITQDGRVDFWSLARRLSEDGYIKPLASRGIVGQVTDKFVVYDAETTFGGSGGPVLNLDGHVIGVNAAIIPEFGGSNMGIPADHVRLFLEQTGELEKE